MNASSRFGADGEGNFQVLWEDGDRVFCRAWRRGADGEGHAVLAVLPAAEQPAPATLERLAHEYGLKDELDGAWAARPLAFVRERGRTMLVLEDTGGQPLDQLLGAPLAVEAFLRLAIAIAAALAQLHRRGLVHKDVKPHNILVHPATGEIRLTGFGIASRLPRERQGPEPPETIAGTLAYMAPEQTGRMNRSINSRSDLYALGVTFYQMLTGSLPFTASEPMEWVHCQIARQPVPPAERLAAIPGAVSAIVVKLLAKTAEDRYQTASGLERDLRRCLAAWEGRRRIEDFPLGEHDTPDRLLIPEKLYGREREVKTLRAAFDRVVKSGAPELVLVSGYAGIGKSSVVNELHKALVPSRGLFASGKFDQYQRNIPYATLAQAFQSLIRSLLSKSDTELGGWRDALREALGPNGQLMVDLVPELRLIIGDQPPVPELEPQQAQRRFPLVLRRFIGVFARPEHPLALFLDDLQWLDAATLDLLEDLLTGADLQHLMLIGAYRDNEATASHPLRRKLDAIKTAGGKVAEITLAPLAREHLGQLIADALHCEPERAAQLAQLVHEKTGGNPFFAIQFLSSLAEEGMLIFDHDAARWSWDLERIHAQRYTDNVADLMVGKLKRLSTATQEALKQLACLGNAAEIATLALVHGETEAAMHAALWEAVHAGLVFREESAYKFLHDRIRQAAYSLIAEAHRAAAHLRIGRVLVASLTADQLTEHLFDVASQFNRGAVLLAGHDEKVQAATLNLRAGRKAKASAAYASARAYFSAGVALLDESDWHRAYGLMFSLSLERAECEYLSGNHDVAEMLISELPARGASKIDKAAAYRLKIDLHVMKSENVKGVESALECLRLFGIEIPAHPTPEQVGAEYEKVWNNLGERSIESLIDLPMMTDPEMRAAMGVLSGLFAPAYFTDVNLVRLHVARMVNVSINYGTTDASAYAYGWFGTTLGSISGRYADGYRFGKLACDLVETHKFLTYRARTCFSMEMVALWTQPIAIALDYIREAFRAGVETGDFSIACYSSNHTITDLLARGDHLDEVWRELERCLDFVRQARFRDVVDVIVSQQRFIENMRGRTASFSTFSDAKFDETVFEAELTEDRMATMVAWYWILKLQARFFSGDYEVSMAAARKAKAMLWASDANIQLLDYYYYTALTVAALYEKASAAEQAGWRDLLTAHEEQLRAWAETYPPTFGDKHALVSAEIARLEGRDADAMRLYEQAIQRAREHGFVQNEGLAHEVAARFYAARGVQTIADGYLCNARLCYLRWGAQAKVRQLERLHPYLHEKPMPASPTATFGTPAAQLDVGTVVKASQAVSGEIILSKLIETLMRIAIEHAGAERGLLILFHSDEPWIEAEARTGSGRVEVTLRQAEVTPSELPESVLHYVIRTRESVILDDAAAPNLFAADAYVRRRRPRSVLCVPLIKQAKLVGVLYLENNLAPHAFTSDRIAILELLASQAAISLENAGFYANLQTLYAELQQENADRRRAEEALQRSEAFLAEGQRISRTGSWGWNLSTGKLVWSEEHCRIFGFDPTEAEPTFQFFQNRLHPEDRALVQRTLDRAILERSGFSLEFRILLPDGSIKYLHGVGRPVLRASGDLDDYIGTTMDITERKRGEEALRNAQADLTRVARLTTIGELAASIAHEINQPIGAMVASGNACLRWLAKDQPQLDEARRAVERIVRDGHRASEVIKSVRALAGTSAPVNAELDINAALREVLSLMRGELHQHDVALETDLSDGLEPVMGDRVQLEQVVLNLILNAVDAMSTNTSAPRVLRVRSQSGEPGAVLITVEDSGPGLAPEAVDRLFEAFFTTKPSGMGMGLSICRSIVEAHGGRLWASQRSPHGAVFQFTVPVAARSRGL